MQMWLHLVRRTGGRPKPILNQLDRHRLQREPDEVSLREGHKSILTKMRKLKTNMRYLMQLRQSPSMVVPRAEASPCPCETTQPNWNHAKHLRNAAKC